MSAAEDMVIPVVEFQCTGYQARTSRYTVLLTYMYHEYLCRHNKRPVTEPVK